MDNVQRNGYTTSASDHKYLEDDYSEQLLALKRSLLESIEEILSKAKTLMVSEASVKLRNYVNEFRSSLGKSLLATLTSDYARRKGEGTRNDQSN